MNASSTKITYLDSESQESYSTQNDLLLNNLLAFYNRDDYENLTKLISFIAEKPPISLRIIDWFVTNYSKKNYTLYPLTTADGQKIRFKVYFDYKLKLKAYSKKRFDPCCRWGRISIPYKNNSSLETTVGQLNFFKWIFENKIVEYIEQNYDAIIKDMSAHNTTTKRKDPLQDNTVKTRKKRKELSISAVKSIKKEDVEIVVSFS